MVRWLRPRPTADPITQKAPTEGTAMQIQTPVSSSRTIRKRVGFTLIEMIGVLAIIAILVAAVAPRIFEAINDSKITSATSTIKTLESAVAKYYSDVGTLLPLNAAGAPTASNGNAAGVMTAYSLPYDLNLGTAPATTGSWSKFRGPYMENLNVVNPPIGNTMVIGSNLAAAALTAAGAVPPNFSLNGGATGSLTNTNQVVWVTFTGVSEHEFEKFDAIMDPSVTGTLVQRETLGKCIWAAANGGTMTVYIASK